MDCTSPIDLGIAEKLKSDEAYRHAFFRAEATDSIALQIRDLRKALDNMTQADLADACGMKQSAISRIEQAEYSSWTFNTLWRVAEALKSRLIITFQPEEQAIKDYEAMDAAATPMKDAEGNVIFPWPPKELSPNARVHWAVKSRAAAKYRLACWALAKEAKLKAAEPVRLQIHFHTPDFRHRDLDNMLASIKSGLDGLADALKVNDHHFKIEAISVPCSGGNVRVVIL